MDKLSNKESKFFEITYYDLKLKFELFSIDYIFDKLKIFEQDKIIFSVHRLQIPNKKPFRSFKEIYIDASNKERYHFFAYIKFFVYEGQKYGLVGGKTNYLYPDISFDYKKNGGISRFFLCEKNFQWHNEIIIVNHKSFLNDRKKDERQAIFLEKFLQRQFNLFDS